jgi:hypothetical protein
VEVEALELLGMVWAVGLLTVPVGPTSVAQAESRVAMMLVLKMLRRTVFEVHVLTRYISKLLRIWCD